MTPPQDTERISKDKIPSVIEALRGLDAKELPDVPAREAIRKMRRQIERVLKLGYTYDEVSEVLAGLDIHISGSRLKYLLGEVRKSTRSRNKKKADYVEGSDGDLGDVSELGDAGESHQFQSEQLLNEKKKPIEKAKPQAQSEQKLPVQQKPPVQSETPVVSPTVDAANDDYQPMVLRKR